LPRSVTRRSWHIDGIHPHAAAETSHTIVIDAARRRQRDRGTPGVGEERHATAEQDRDDVESQLVDDPGVEVLPDDGSTPRDADVAIAGRLAGQAQGGVGPSVTNV
jgi:hypothetical protein